MITTTAAIGNPIDFLREELTEGSLLNEAGWQIVSGADFDVLVQRQQDDGFGVSVDSVSPVYDRLYPRGLVRGAHILGETVCVEWYLSPTAANALSEQLGRTPGVDVLKFTHSPEDEITSYTPAIREGKYLQSTGKEFFVHDRYRLHAPGIWLMTAAGFAKLTEVAHSRMATVAPIYLDSGTVALTFMAENLLAADFDISNIQTQYGFGSSSELLGCKSSRIKLISRKSDPRRGELEYMALAEHMQHDLMPAVQRLLPDTPPLKDQALAVFNSLGNQ